MPFGISNSLQQFVELFFPRYCLVCGRKLIQGEVYLCLKCLLQMPKTNHHLQQDNPLEQLFIGRVKIERACAFIEFKKGSPYQKLVHELKYHGKKDLGVYLGRLFGTSLKDDPILTKADFICPVPLHPRKERKRGYNQSYQLASGIAEMLHIPANQSNLVKLENTGSQTKKNRWERWQNVDGLFLVKDPEFFANKHIILVDDVATTGATLEACAKALSQCDNVRISILSFAMA